MKKQIAILSLAGLALVATPAFAKEKGEHRGMSEGLGLHLGIKNFLRAGNPQFVVVGTVDTVTTDMLTVKVKADANVSNVTNGEVSIKTDANTKIMKAGQAIQLSDLKSGDNVVAVGTAGTDLTASMVKVASADNDDQKPVEKKSNKAIGQVTAVTDNSVTIKNSLTGVTQTITTDANTKVNIDGQSKAVSDVQVGDSGWIRFKTMGTTLVAKFIHLFR